MDSEAPASVPFVLPRSVMRQRLLFLPVIVGLAGGGRCGAGVGQYERGTKVTIEVAGPRWTSPYRRAV